MLQQFFEEHSISIWIEKTPEGWAVKINSKLKSEYRYDVLLNAWEMAFSVAFNMMEMRYGNYKEIENLTARDIYNSLLDILPVAHRNNFNNFNANINTLRRNKLKNFVFTEGVDWNKDGNISYYTQAGFNKIKQYFINFKK